MQNDNGKDPLLLNKIFGAGLAALLLIFGLPQLTAAIFGGEHHGGEEKELHLAYCCVDLESSGGEKTAEKAPPDLGTLLANASVAGGERRAALCKSCHTLEQGGPNSTGPNLWGVVGRPVASHAGFNYTSALKEAGGVWTYERLNEFLRNSQAYIPGTAMTQHFPRDNQRADILAFLGSLSDNPVPFPEPVAVEAPADNAAGDNGDETASESSENSTDAVAGDAGSDAEKGADAADETADDNGAPQEPVQE